MSECSAVNQSPVRLTRPLQRRQGIAKGISIELSEIDAYFEPVCWQRALNTAAGGLLRLRRDHGGEAVAGIGSASCTNEEAYLLQKLIRQAFGHNNLGQGNGEQQGFIEAGLAPNYLPGCQLVSEPNAREQFNQLWRGDAPSALNLFYPEVGYPVNAQQGLSVTEIMQAMATQQIKGLYLLGNHQSLLKHDGEDDAGIRQALMQLEVLIVQDSCLTDMASFADVILPAAAMPEKNGTLIDPNSCVQIARQSCLPPEEAREDWQILVAMARLLDLNWLYHQSCQIFSEMKQAMPSLCDIHWQRQGGIDSIETRHHARLSDKLNERFHTKSIISD